MSFASSLWNKACTCPSSVPKIYALSVPVVIVWLPEVIASWLRIPPNLHLGIFLTSVFLSMALYFIIAVWFRSMHKGYYVTSANPAYETKIRTATMYEFVLVNVIYMLVLILEIAGTEY